MVMTRKDWIHVGEVVIIGLLFFTILIIASVGAISWGGDPKYFNYSINVLPNNSYVHQGENISQGNYYDLSGIYGFSGVVVSWKDDDNAGITQPEYAITLSHPRKVYIDPETFPAGRYYQWDGGMSCSSTGNSDSGSNYFKDGALVTVSSTGNSTCMGMFGHDNTYVFAVVGPVGLVKEVAQQDRIVTHTANITEQIGNQTVVVQVTYNETIKGEISQSQSVAQQQTIIVPETPTPTNTPVIGPTAQNVVDTNGNPINGIAGNYEQVTPRTPIPIFITVLSIIAAIGLITWRNKRG
jgi:hypothetical protein